MTHCHVVYLKVIIAMMFLKQGQIQSQGLHLYMLFFEVIKVTNKTSFYVSLIDKGYLLDIA